MKKKYRIKSNVLNTIIVMISLGGILTLAVYSGIYLNLIILKTAEKHELEAILNDLKKEEVVLETNVRKLQDPEYVARYARERFLYSKDTEFVIRIPGY